MVRKKSFYVHLLFKFITTIVVLLKLDLLPELVMGHSARSGAALMLTFLAACSDFP
jgi:hypothetical protein